MSEKLAGVTSAVLERGHFAETVDEELMCPLCHGVVVAPLQCKEGHVFCKGCIEKTLLEKGVCPVDRSALQVADLSPVLAVEQTVNRKRVRCPCAAQHTDEEDGCDWVGKVSERQKHINDACVYTTVPCPHDGCEVRVQRRAVEEHAASCEQRAVPCEHCGEGGVVSQRAQHEQVCPQAVVECPFKEVGCTAPSMPRKDAAAHARAAAEEHAALALAAQEKARAECWGQAVVIQKSAESLKKAAADSCALMQRVQTAEEKWWSTAVTDTWVLADVEQCIAQRTAQNLRTLSHRTVLSQKGCEDLSATVNVHFDEYGLDVKIKTSESCFTPDWLRVELHDARGVGENQSLLPTQYRRFASFTLNELRGSYLTVNSSMTIITTLSVPYDRRRSSVWKGNPHASSKK